MYCRNYPLNFDELEWVLDSNSTTAGTKAYYYPRNNRINGKSFFTMAHDNKIGFNMYLILTNIVFIYFCSVKNCYLCE